MTDTKQAIIKKEKIASISDGLEISILLCGPVSGTPKGIVQIVHGMCEHKERYIPFMEYLAATTGSSVSYTTTADTGSRCAAPKTSGISTREAGRL